MSTTTTTASLAGRTVARIGFGAMQLERHHDTPDAGVAVLHRALELGVDHIDTADFYGNGFVNDLIRRAVSADAGVMIVSKVGAVPDPGGEFPLRPAQRPEELRAAVQDNLRGLGLDTIPLVNLRRLEVGPGLAAQGDQVVAVDDQLAEMAAMRDEGLIGAIGLSAVTTETLRHALPVGIACIQNPYNLLDRRFEDMLDLCVREDIAWVPFFPLGSAFPGMPKVTDDPTVIAAAEHTGATPSQVGLAWLLDHTPNTLLIPGTGSVGHLEENMSIADVHLETASRIALDAVGAASTTEPIHPPTWPRDER
ncbi:aldo/keto reductase [Curtobacterium sp. Leaf261]|uniref:aldo/keto reductase n=1 Tax=Curtobacterium sp. Leaf261 TaxID=1736311 RepID=UPI0006F5A991|nr:aldo/keto reductase [Curtobacterium sp. Leaf261]KQO64414.1 aldo/keto reductase [Curtobacterium sp. Leaf261]